MLTILGSCLAFMNFAQNGPIMVCNAAGTSCQPYSNIDSAIVQANPGNYIYLPGGVFVINVNIDKEIHLFGAGHNMDSAMVTGTTVINGNIVLVSGASNSSFEGLYLTNSFYGPGSPAIENLTVRHCNFHLFNMNINNSTIHASILRSAGYADNTFYSGINNQITNCYITNITNLSSSTIDRCTGLNFFNNVFLTTVKNSICSTYPNSPYGQPGGSNTVMNLAYVNSCPYACISVIYANNFTAVPISSLFANGFNYNDMHLVAGSPALTAGENGTQAGVYGGLFPFKEGSVPGNPHIFQKSIGASTDANGQLPVQIKVRAENY